jgi:hypothetical protein
MPAEKTAASAHEQLMLARAEHEQLEADRRRRPAIERIPAHRRRSLGATGAGSLPRGVFAEGFCGVLEDPFPVLGSGLHARVADQVPHHELQRQRGGGDVYTGNR